MEVERLRRYLLEKPGAAEDFPFDEKTLVLKVAGKMFALISLNQQPLRMNLKCDPLLADVLRDKYGAVQPGYHMHKRHWNTLLLDGSIPENEVLGMIDASYGLVVNGLPKARRPDVRQADNE